VSEAGITVDALLDQAVSLRQPRAGYRAGSDAILLAAAVPARAGDAVLDVGAGVGAASLCLAWRCPGVQVIGLEIQPECIELATMNAEANSLAARVHPVHGDVAHAPAEIRQRRFDHVMTNPPFYADRNATRSPRGGKAVSHVESVPLADWLDFCVRRVRPGGTVTVIHRTERLAEILTAMAGRLGGLVVCPLWSHPERPAKRVIVQGRAGARGATIIHPGVQLHGPGGGDTAAARALLREGAALDLAAAKKNGTA
jgi:FkbM family methyltransferase